jgi:hypothetical protein
MVEPAFDPLGAVAAVAEPVTFEFAVGRVTGEDERIHEGLPLQLEFCSNAEMGQKIGRLFVPGTKWVQNGRIGLSASTTYLSILELSESLWIVYGGGGGSRSDSSNSIHVTY